MNDRDCENCKHHTEKGCDSWDCEFEQVMTKEDIHREKEQAYMQGYEDACKKYRQEPCEDAISREAVHETIEKWAGSMAVLVALPTREVRPLLDSIHKLPSVNPQEPKTGHWIEHPEIKTSAPEYLMFYECSECGDKQCFCKSDIHKKHFCNNCGAKMVEPLERDKKDVT